MKEFIRKSELVLENVAVTLTVDVENALALVEINNVETELNSTGGYDVKVKPEGATAGLDSDELDEIIIMLQQASEALKRDENRM